MRAATAREKLKWCLTAWIQNSSEESRQKLAAESEALFAASPMTFFQGTDIGRQDDFERLMGSPDGYRTRSATDPTSRASNRYSRIDSTIEEAKDRPDQARRSTDLYSTSPYASDHSSMMGGAVPTAPAFGNRWAWA